MLTRIRKFYTNDSFEFTGFNKKPSTCKMEIWRSEEYDTGKLIRYIMLVSDVYNNKRHQCSKYVGISGYNYISMA